MMLRTRLVGDEMMDDFEIADSRLTDALETLPRLNRLLGAYAVLRSSLVRAVRDGAGTGDGRNFAGSRDVSILDAGSGIGDIPLMLARRFNAMDIPVSILATDGNPFTSAYAKTAADERLSAEQRKLVEFQVADALSLPFEDDSFDYVIATQLLHHFEHEDAVRCVAEMQRVSRCGILVNDLHRHWLPYYGIMLIVRILRMPQMIVNDAPISVHRGFVREELNAIAVDAGLQEFQIRWHLPFRWSLSTLQPRAN